MFDNKSKKNTPSVIRKRFQTFLTALENLKPSYRKAESKLKEALDKVEDIKVELSKQVIATEKFKETMLDTNAEVNKLEAHNSRISNISMELELAKEQVLKYANTFSIEQDYLKNIKSTAKVPLAKIKRAFRIKGVTVPLI